jgi:cytochrome b pre-mRNA-processing protein 3
MFGLLKKKNPNAAGAKRLYSQLLLKTRERGFYTSYGVPDTFDGRFDLLLLHIFIVVNRMLGEGAAGHAFNQALFDVTFADMDQTLREAGIGDMGVPKHQRRMMKAFNGRMHVYEEAIKQGDGAMVIALRRNLYGTLEDETVPDTQKILRYIKDSIAAMDRLPVQQILKGTAAFAPANENDPQEKR